MINKIYEKFKKFIKENYKFIIFYSLFLLVCTYPLDYEVYTPGGLYNLNKRIEVQNGFDSKGSFNLTYVSARRGVLPVILLSYIIPSWDLVSLDESRIENEDASDILERSKIDLKQVNENAIIVAFNEAKKSYDITNNELTVYYVLEESKSNLKTGDIIKKVNDTEVKDFDEFSNIIDSLKVGDKVVFNIIRDHKSLEKTGIIYESEGKKVIGLYLINVTKVKPSIDVKFNYKGNEGGPSGGLMSTLEIYDNLVEEDITKGLVIAGTGTINQDGTVGEIGGVRYKLMGAVKNDADVFIVPSGNYEEAISVKKEFNYDIKIIKAESFKQVLNSLKEI